MQQFCPIIIALTFNVIDLLSGMVSAVKNKEISSQKLRDGMFKKVGFIFCYIVAWLVDSQAHLIGFDLSVKILPAIILYTCTTELISIIENIAQINSDLLPKELMKLFHITKGD